MDHRERHNQYQPCPIDTSGIVIPDFLSELSEALASNAHDVWAEQRFRAGWRYGASRNDMEKIHPCLVPYEELPDEEKEYDRRMVKETIRSILSFGYDILRADAGG